MTAYRYWRIWMAKNAGDASFSQFAEVEMRTTAGGADQCSGGTASASASPQAGTAAGAFANDGVTTFIQWNGTGSVYIQYDFGAGNDKDIVEVAIMGATGAASRALGQGWVQGSSDGTNFTTIWAISYTGGYVTGTNVVFTKPTATSAYRYWRTRLDNCLSNVFSISEMEMATALGGADQCSGGTGLAYTGTAANAFDNTTATFWNSTSLANHEYLGYDFGSGVTKQVIEIRLTPRQDTSNSKQWPRTIYSEAGSDGINWLPIWTVANSLMTYSDGAYTFRNPSSVTAATPWRFIGIRPTAIQSGTNFGVREVEFRIAGTDNTSGGVAGSIHPFDSGGGAHNGFDGTTAEYGSDSSGTSDILAYDYGAGNEKAAPDQVAITARASANNGQAPTAFDLVASNDGHNWTTIQSYSTGATWASAEQRVFGGTATGRRRLMFAA